METSASRAAAFLDDQRPSTPSLVLDLDVVTRRYRLVADAVPGGRVWYAVKANPTPALLAHLHGLGSAFDIASFGELTACLAAGATGAELSFGNTAKRPEDIRRARAAGVELFVFDAPSELEKLAAHAPGASVFCRLAVEADGAAWPLGRKFGCTVDEALAMLGRAADLGLRPRGTSFHIGSQQRDPTAWDRAAAFAAEVIDRGRRQGLPLDLVNLGGGLPARYTADDAPEAHVAAMGAAIRAHLAGVETIIVEPGRYMVADAGIMETEVLLVRREPRTGALWVHLDAGRYSGLTEGDTVAYPLEARRDGARLGGPEADVILAGPTCDSDDVFGLSLTYRLPADIRVGDRVRLSTTGAYGNALDIQGYNGIQLPRLHVV
ncbi:MAG: type III PLP-dependent enzyme [Myxococcales bacterium]|nr:type III PLP-dependent enzyme [Myxococcales bacterium]MCB9547517.1 type III PLP-dependent enzyme [Myxococcales bacterium]